MPSKNSTQFHHFASAVAHLMGNPWAFIVSFLVIIVWGIVGPFFNFSDTWQLVINTGTTVITFLMVFVIQNTQNRDAKALHLKLDELIYHMKGARNTLIDLEDLSEEELDTLQQEFVHLKAVGSTFHKKGHHAIKKEIERRQDVGQERKGKRKKEKSR